MPVPRRLTIIFLAKLLPDLGLRPRRHSEQQHLLQAPDMIGQARRHRWCTRSPHLGRAAAVGRPREQQGLAQTGVGQAQNCGTSGTAPADRASPLRPCTVCLPDAPPPPRADGFEVESLHKGGVDLPATCRQDLLDRQLGAEHHAVLDPDETPTPVRLNLA